MGSWVYDPTYRKVTTPFITGSGPPAVEKNHTQTPKTTRGFFSPQPWTAHGNPITGFSVV